MNVIKKILAQIKNLFSKAKTSFASFCSGLKDKIKNKNKDGQSAKKIKKRRLLSSFWEIVCGNTVSRYAVLLAVLILNAALLVLFVQIIDRGSPEAGAAWLSAHESAAVYTAAAVFFFTFFLYCLTGRLILSMTIPDTLALVLVIISYFKTAVNGEPLSPQDFGMTKDLAQLGGMSSGFVKMTEPIALCLLVMIIFYVYVWPFSTELIRTRRKSVYKRFLAGILSLLAAVLLFSPFAKTALMPNIGVYPDIRKNQSAVYTEDGFILGLYCSATSGKTPEPEGYGEEYMNKIFDKIKDYAESHTEKEEGPEKPNVILILSESFFDMTRLPNITLSQNPAPYFTELCQSGKVIHGGFFTRQCGYGTGNVEIEVLTGTSGRLFPFSASLSYDLSPKQLRKLDPVPARFRESGYYTAAVHTFNNSLYNRTANFPALGFDSVKFQTDLKAEYSYDYSSLYVLSDKFLSDTIIKEYEANRDKGPCFIYGISMENHQPYVDKYASFPISVSSSKLKSEELEPLATFARGAMGADTSYAELIEYFSKSPEPTIIAVYGDHLPSLPLEDGQTVYQKLGIYEDKNREAWTVDECKFMFTADYFIWSNFSKPAEGQDYKNSSSNLLGRDLIKYAGIDATYFDTFLQMYSEKVGMWNEYTFTDASGNFYPSVPPEYKEITDMYYAINYDTYFGKGYITDKLNGLVPQNKDK